MGSGWRKLPHRAHVICQLCLCGNCDLDLSGLVSLLSISCGINRNKRHGVVALPHAC